jgi:hypothetical protein
MAQKLEILKTNYPAVYERLENDYAAQFGTEKSHWGEEESKS